jgi:excisionase family DNA binding protein
MRHRHLASGTLCNDMQAHPLRGTDDEAAAERWFTVSEVYARTRIPERTLRALIATGRLRAVRPAGLRMVRVPESAVAELMAGTR